MLRYLHQRQMFLKWIKFADHFDLYNHYQFQGENIAKTGKKLKVTSACTLNYEWNNQLRMRSQMPHGIIASSLILSLILVNHGLLQFESK